MSTCNVGDVRLVSSPRSPWSPTVRVRSLLWSAWLRLPSKIRMVVYKSFFWLGIKLNYEGGTTAQHLPFNLYAKYGRKVRFSEVTAMQHVEKNTSIPVPVVLDALKDDGGVFILMTRLPGTPFGQSFVLDDMSTSDVADFETTLRDWLTQLRSLPPPSSEISSFDGSQCRSYRVRYESDFGPFSSEDTFHDHLYKTVPRRFHEDIRNKAIPSHSIHHRICLTHGDIHPNNILILNGRLSGLVDWECAGWYPEYWEYTSALHFRMVYKGWLHVFQRIFPQYAKELEVERAFWAVHNPF